MLTKLAGWLAVAFAIYYLLTDPAGAAAFARSVLDGLRHAGNSLSSFANHL